MIPATLLVRRVALATDVVLGREAEPAEFVAAHLTCPTISLSFTDITWSLVQTGDMVAATEQHISIDLSVGSDKTYLIFSNFLPQPLPGHSFAIFSTALAESSSCLLTACILAW